VTLVELYEQTPVEEQGNILVVGNQVYIIDGDGDANLEYLIGANDELIPVYSYGKQKRDIKEIKTRLRI